MSLIDLTVNLAGMELEHPLMNAAGTCKVLFGDEGLRKLVKTPSAAVMIGSATVKQIAGNSGDVFWTSKDYSLNSLGLPNPGFDYYASNLPEMVKLAHGAGKKLFFSIAGFTPNEFAKLAILAVQCKVDLLELNLGCPNLWEGATQKRIICFDPQLVSDVLDVVSVMTDQFPVTVKVSPYSDPFLLKQIAEVLVGFKMVRAVTTTNTFPNSLALGEAGKPRITPAGGLSGLGGAALKPIGLGQVRQWREALPKEVSIIGVGGITCGRDILDYLRAGATAVQVATSYLVEGPRVFDRLLTEYAELV